jgi:hypothetical protein
MKRQATVNPRGVVLVLVTVIGAIAGILALSMLGLGYEARILSVRNVEGMSARAAADAGLADAVFWMQKKLIREPHWDATAFPRTIGPVALAGASGSYSYTITKLADGYHRYQIDSTGVTAGQTKAVHTILYVGSLWKGVGVERGFTANVNVQFGGDIEIRTNSASSADGQITLKAGVVVPGDVVIGPGGNVDNVLNIKASTITSGETPTAEDELVFPPVSAPTPALGMLAMTTSTTVSTGGTYRYPSITLPNSGKLIITAPNVKLYVSGDMTLKNAAEVVVQAGASLELYLGGNLVNQNSVGFSNNANDPGALKIYGLPTCTSIDLKAKSDLYAALYAPNAAVNLYNSGSFYGAVCSKSFEIKNSGNFYYDNRVKAVLIDDIAAVFETERWWED